MGYPGQRRGHSPANIKKESILTESTTNIKGGEHFMYPVRSSWSCPMGKDCKDIASFYATEMQDSINLQQWRLNKDFASICETVWNVFTNNERGKHYSTTTVQESDLADYDESTKVIRNPIRRHPSSDVILRSFLRTPSAHTYNLFIARGFEKSILFYLFTFIRVVFLFPNVNKITIKMHSK